MIQAIRHIVETVAVPVTADAGARELLEQGTYGKPEDLLPFGEVNSMFAREISDGI